MPSKMGIYQRNGKTNRSIKIFCAISLSAHCSLSNLLIFIYGNVFHLRINKILSVIVIAHYGSF